MVTKSSAAAPASGYFPQQHQFPNSAPDAETISNTLANSHLAQSDHNTHLAAPVAPRPNGRFTEEWEVSQRGSSLIDNASPGANMQRANSFSGSVMGAGS